ncbi:hypothetical protein AMJ49_06635 [Parcubacteria bacterium DG_74_2]|nr:MAG: hypothetical protein AMJ49_06635 [Parcubacteria bacterium DG_74_2]
MQKQERVCIFIDGANFYHLVLKKLNTSELNFCFEDFVKFLANKRKIIRNGKRFYIGTVREIEGDLRSKQAMAKQTTLFATLKSYDWEIKTSKLRVRIEKIVIDNRVINYQKFLKKGVKEIKFRRIREKGIDVKMATDLIVGAVDNKYDTAIIVSSDTDLTPAIDWVRKRQNKIVEYIGFSIKNPDSKREDTRPSQGMITYSDIQRILVASDIRQFIKPFIQKK